MQLLLNWNVKLMFIVQNKIILILGAENSLGKHKSVIGLIVSAQKIFQEISMYEMHGY